MADVAYREFKPEEDADTYAGYDIHNGGNPDAISTTSPLGHPILALRIFGALLAFFVWLFIVIPLGTDRWTVIDIDVVMADVSGQVTAGPLKFCTKFPQDTACSTWSGDLEEAVCSPEASQFGVSCNDWKGTIAMTVFAMLSSLVSLGVFSMMIPRQSSALSMTAIISCLNTALWGMIAFALWATIASDLDLSKVIPQNIDVTHEKTYGFSFGLLVTAWVMNFVLLGFAVYGRPRN